VAKAALISYHLLVFWPLILLACPSVGFLANGLRGAGQGLAIGVLILAGACVLVYFSN